MERNEEENWGLFTKVVGHGLEGKVKRVVIFAGYFS